MLDSSRYLFVVKDPTSESLSKSSDKERRLIHRHVQIDHIRRRSAANFKNIQLPVIEVFPALTQSRTPKLVVHGSHQPAPSSSTPLINPRLPCRCFTKSTKHCPVHHTIPRVPASESHVTDPFASTSVNVERQAHALLQYFIHVSHPRTWHSELRSLPDHSYTFQSDAMTIMRGSLEHEVHFYTLIASMASQLQYFEHVTQYKDSTTPLVQKAINAIQHYLKSSPTIDQRLIFDIHQLAVTEFFRFDLESSLIHFKADRSLIAQIGGLQCIDPSLKEWIVIGDGFLAGERLRRPIYPASSFDPGARNLHYKEVSQTSPSRLQEARYHDLLPAQMRDILLDVNECVEVMHLQFRANMENPAGSGISQPTLHWLLLRTTALRHRLLELEVDDGRVNAIRVAVIIWLFLVMTVTGRQRTCKVIASKLRAVLVEIRQEVWVGFEDSLLWLVLLGAMSSEGHDREWFLLAICELKHHLEQGQDTPFGEDALARFSKDFYYLQEVQRPMLRNLVNELRHIEELTYSRGPY